MPPASLSLPLVTLLFVAGLGLTGLFLLRTGWRGRRLDDHPVCRRCRFDLTGIPRGGGGEPPRCPECGWRREPRVGNRRRSGLRIASGAVLLGLALVGSGAVAWSRADAAGLAAVKPVWLLRIEARTGESDAAAVALRELTDRLLVGELSADQGEQLIVEALAHGPAGNPTVYHASIGSSWDRLAAELMRAGHGSDEQRVALAKSWLDLSVRVRPRVEQGAVLPMELSGGTYGPPTDVGLWRTPQQATVSINGHTHPIGYSRSGPVEGGRGFGPSSRAEIVEFDLRSDVFGTLAEGTHAVYIEQPVEITDGPSGTPLVAWIEKDVLDFDIVVSGQDSISLIQDQNLGKQIQDSLSIKYDELRRAGSARIYFSVSLDDNARRIPPFAFRIELRHGKDSWWIGDISGEKDAHGITFNLNQAIPPRDLQEGDLVDVVFIPSVAAAKKTVGLTSIIDHEFVIPGVPVTSTFTYSPP